MRIRLTTSGDDASLVLLGRWLSQSDVYKGRVRRVRGKAEPGAMGAVLDALTVEAGLAVAGLTMELVAWLRRRSGAVEIEVSSPDGTTVKVRAQDVRGLDVDGLRALSNDVAARLTGGFLTRLDGRPEVSNPKVIDQDGRPSSGGKRIFVSYVREDSAIVDRLVSALTRHGFDVWWDQVSLLAGQKWKAVIRREIRTRDGFVACFSPRYVAKSQSFMNEELTIAVEHLRLMPRHRHWLIPIVLEPCEIPDHMVGSDETLNVDIQCLDFSGNWDEAEQQLILSLEALGA